MGARKGIAGQAGGETVPPWAGPQGASIAPRAEQAGAGLASWIRTGCKKRLRSPSLSRSGPPQRHASMELVQVPMETPTQRSPSQTQGDSRGHWGRLAFPLSYRQHTVDISGSFGSQFARKYTEGKWEGTRGLSRGCRGPSAWTILYCIS